MELWGESGHVIDGESRCNTIGVGRRTFGGIGGSSGPTTSFNYAPSDDPNRYTKRG